MAGRAGGRHGTLVLVVAAVLALLAGFALGRVVPTAGTPGDDSAAAGFARDMQTHHAQAVQMSMVVVHEGIGSDVRQLADDITVTQEQQIGQMYAWLQLWGLPQTGQRPAMAWMSTDGDGHGMAGMGGGGSGATGAAAGRGGTSAMPGMASSASLQQLQRARGRAAEVLYLRLMVAHHRGGVTMAQAVLAQPAPEQVHRLARAVVSAQQAEIGAMQDMLRERGAAAA